LIKLALWVEGDRDRRFCDGVLKPVFGISYGLVLVREYRQLPRPVVNKLLRSMSCEGFDHLFFADQDTAPCVSSRKSKVKQGYPDLTDDRIVVVSREIESWFLAGIQPSHAKRFAIPILGRTDDLSKADFDEYRKRKFDSDIDSMAEIVKVYSIAEALQRNRTFEYLHGRFLAPISSVSPEERFLPFGNEAE